MNPPIKISMTLASGHKIELTVDEAKAVQQQLNELFRDAYAAPKRPVSPGDWPYLWPPGLPDGWPYIVTCAVSGTEVPAEEPTTDVPFWIKRRY